MSGLITIATLLKQIDDNPIEGGKAAQKRYLEGVRYATYESSVSAGALYRKLKKSVPLTSAFYSLPFWAGANVRDPKHLNKHCHQFVYGARDGSEGKRAEDHAYATQSYLDDDDRSFEEILGALKKGGFDGLKKAASAQETHMRLKEMDARERKRSRPVGDDEAAANGKDVVPPPKPRLSEGNKTPQLPKITMEQVFNHLLVAMKQHELDNFLEGKSQIGDRVGILVERELDAENGMLVWRAVEIKKELEDA